MTYLASDSMGGVALYNPSTGQYNTSPAPRTANSIALLEKKIAEGFMPIQDVDSPEGKVHLQKFMNEANQPSSMLVREKSFDSPGKVTNILKDLLGKVGGKLPGVLGILDIMGMKKEYDQIMAGEHPMFQEVKPISLKDGGYVTNPLIEDIFDN